MASSRRSASSAAAADAVPSVDAALDAALHAVLAGDVRVAIAFSGGLDSTVLLDALARRAAPERLVAVHVAHGLQPAADAWPEHCAEQARARGVRFHNVVLEGAPPRGESVEAWARRARYAALADAARGCGASVLVTAHHEDDQLETLLMRLARGAGPDGFTGIAPQRAIDGLSLVRPLLEVPRRTLAAYAQARGLSWVNDPSNDHDRFLRNALRRRVLPVFEAVAPSLRQSLPRAAAHWRDARALLAEVAQADIAAADDGEGGLRCSALRALTPARRAWALRAWWCAPDGPRAPVAPPTTRQLDELQRTLLDAPGPGPMRVGELWIWRSGDRLRRLWASGSLARALCAAREAVDLPVRWDGQAQLPLPGGLGAVTLEPWSVGDHPVDAVPVASLREATLRTAPGHRTGLRIAVRPGGPSRTLKNLYQEHAVPAWVRPVLPVLACGDRALWSAAFGADRQAGDRPPWVRLGWVPPEEASSGLRAVRARFAAAGEPETRHE